MTTRCFTNDQGAGCPRVPSVRLFWNERPAADKDEFEHHLDSCPTHVGKAVDDIVNDASGVVVGLRSLL